MLTKTTVLSLLLVAACQNSSQLDTVPTDPYARPIESEPTVKVISVERLGDAPEHPTAATEAQARRYETVTRRRAQTSRFEPRPGDAGSSVRAGAGDTTSGARSEPIGTPVWPPTEVDQEPVQSSRQGEGAGANAAPNSNGPFSKTSSGHGTTTNTGVNTENQGTGGTDDPTQ